MIPLLLEAAGHVPLTGTPCSSRAGMGRYFRFYNGIRTYSSLDRRTPDPLHLN